MKKDPLYYFFKEDSKTLYDCEQPKHGHTNRFKTKLEAQLQSDAPKSNNSRSFIQPLISIAAILLVLLSVGLFISSHSKTQDLADVSEEMSKTQSFFSLAIEQELAKIEGKRTAETEKLIEDAMTQLSQLEDDYEHLKEDLEQTGGDQRVIHAMISNFQLRIALLQNVLKNINQINNYKNDRNENTGII